MNELSTPKGGGVSVIEDLARQARYFAEGAASNMLQLGRVLCEAKELVDHGDWESWVKDNAGVDLRAAQYFMSSYKKYGADSPLAKLGPSKLFALLPMSNEEIEKMDAEKPLDSRSVREIKEAVKKARAEEREKFDKEREETAADNRRAIEDLYNSQKIELQKQKEALEKRMKDALAEAERQKELAVKNAVNAVNMEKDMALKAEYEQHDYDLKVQTEKRDALIAEMRTEIEAKEKAIAEKEEAIIQMQETAKAAIEGNRGIQTANAETEKKMRELEDELREKDEAITELQEGYDQMQAELLNAQSQIAKGDAGRSNSEILSADAVMEAVNTFMGSVGRVPYMHGAFATMEEQERETYRHGVMMIKEWAEKSLNTIETVMGNGVVVE